jgi:23S rRNA G2445 N2-methylase RlmL
MKVLEVLADSRENVETPEDLYGLARQIEWGSLLLPESSGVRRGAYDDNHDEENGVMTLSVEAVLGQTSMELRHSHFCALTVKNAAVDACREDPNNMQGQRPNVK